MTYSNETDIKDVLSRLSTKKVNYTVFIHSAFTCTMVRLVPTHPSHGTYSPPTFMSINPHTCTHTLPTPHTNPCTCTLSTPHTKSCTHTLSTPHTCTHTLPTPHTKACTRTLPTPHTCTHTLSIPHTNPCTRTLSTPHTCTCALLPSCS